MNIGISTACLYPMYTEKALETLLGQGFRLFEIDVYKRQNQIRDLHILVHFTGKEKKFGWLLDRLFYFGPPSGIRKGMMHQKLFTFRT